MERADGERGDWSGRAAESPGMSGKGLAMIGALRSGQSAVLAVVPEGGRLEARRLRSGTIRFYWCQRNASGGMTRIGVGAHREDSAGGRQLPQEVRHAMREAGRLAREAASDPSLLTGRRERARAEHESFWNEAAKGRSLRALCAEYTLHLAHCGKSSYQRAQSAVKSELYLRHPKISELPADQVTPSVMQQVVDSLVKAGRPNAARLLRSHLHAAYACATGGVDGFARFRVKANPVDGVGAVRRPTDAVRPLTRRDLQRYWKALKNEPGTIGAALRLQVLTGAQRAAQLVRLRAQDVRSGVIHLRDPMGNRATPADHLVPVTRGVAAELRKLPAEGNKLSNDGGSTAMHVTNLSTWASDAASRAGIKDFSVKRLREGIDACLAREGVPTEVRAALQSNRSSARSSDSDMLTAKRAALQALWNVLEPGERD